MHITHDEDDNLKRLLSFSIAAIRRMCGPFDIEKNESAKELVFERTRYLYGDALEYFNENFLSDINSLALSIATQEDDPDAAV
ncbi:hypothetical protein [Fictibacillus fluitans]|uniref:Phage gp6-like head-tail connector protein n=1 Tax=Fictibacillus fluitans TaxID=3058422 RepID=A0ABT8HX18_9BACL|nr:hypothetical protein [Fictibacillus sp. NE201]MDN4525326.1 hypothetical protein [Fictibacillus sp. NE201]